LLMRILSENRFTSFGMRFKPCHRLADRKNGRPAFHRMGYEALEGLRPAPEFSRRIADIMRIKDEPARIGTKIIDPAGLACSPIVRLSYFHCLQKGKIDHAAI